MTFPDISPIAFEIGPLVVRWYALAYVIGILIAQRYVVWVDQQQAISLIPKNAQKGTIIYALFGPILTAQMGSTIFNEYMVWLKKWVPNPILSPKARDDLVLYGVFGIILGGRLGYVLFYNLPYYFDNPGDIWHVWQGGMAFHGGFAGVLIAFAIFARRYKISWLALMDRFAVATPIGLFLGRCANFVNGELYGRVTDVPWGVIFPHGGAAPRHPSQLYEAGLEGVVLGLLLWLLATRTKALNYVGVLGGTFVAGYGVARFIVECFREPDAQLGFLALGLTMGQWLCVPMVAVGLWAVVSARGRHV